MQSTGRQQRNPLLAALIISAGIAALLLGCAAGARAAEDAIQVRTEGHAEGTGLAARRAAIEKAQEEALIRMIQAIVAMPDLSPVQHMLLQPDRYIQRFDVLRYDAIGQTTRVEIDAFINERRLQHDLAEVWLPRLVDSPRALLLVGQQLDAAAPMTLPVDGEAQQVLREGLEQAGISVVGIESLRESYSNERLLEVILGDIEAGRAFARGAAVDVVILGAAVSHAESAGPNLLRNRCKVTLRFFRGMDGKMAEARSAFAAVHSAAAEAGALQAMRDACAKLVEEAKVATVITVLGRQQRDEVLISIENPGSRARLAELTAVIAFAPFVKEVEELYYASDLARLRVDYEGPMAQLVDTLQLNRYAGAKAEVRRAVGREILLAFP